MYKTKCIKLTRRRAHGQKLLVALAGKRDEADAKRRLIVWPKQMTFKTKCVIKNHKIYGRFQP